MTELTKHQLIYLFDNCCSGCQKTHSPEGCFQDEAEIILVEGKPTCHDFTPASCDKTVDMFGNANDQ